MKKIERIAALETQLTKALTALAVLEARVAMLESQKWRVTEYRPIQQPVIVPYITTPQFAPAPPLAPPWTVTCEAKQ